jgi:hypothetical protein
MRKSYGIPVTTFELLFSKSSDSKIISKWGTMLRIRSGTVWHEITVSYLVRWLVGRDSYYNRDGRFFAFIHRIEFDPRVQVQFPEVRSEDQ